MTVCQLICDAIGNRRLVSFRYDGYVRTVEPHAIGLDGRGHEALRAFQIAGGSQSGEVVGWKLFHVREMLSLTILEQRFDGSRPGYRRDDKAFRSIERQV